MLIHCPNDFTIFLTLRAFDLDYRIAHALPSRGNYNP
jgi:hypothetical protein